MNLKEVRALAEKVADEVENRDAAALAERAIELCGALSLAVYYVDGDSAYEGLILQIKNRFGLDVK
jgi:hypothetical protein